VRASSGATWLLVPLAVLGTFLVTRARSTDAVLVLWNNVRIPGDIVSVDTDAVTIRDADSVALTVSRSELRAIEYRR